MKAILEFTLPEEATEHMIALQGTSLLSALTEIQRLIRCHEKHEQPLDLEGIKTELRRGVEAVGAV